MPPGPILVPLCCRGVPSRVLAGQAKKTESSTPILQDMRGGDTKKVPDTTGGTKTGTASSSRHDRRVGGWGGIGATQRRIILRTCPPLESHHLLVFHRSPGRAGSYFTTRCPHPFPWRWYFRTRSPWSCMTAKKIFHARARFLSLRGSTPRPLWPTASLLLLPPPRGKRDEPPSAESTLSSPASSSSTYSTRARTKKE